MKKDASLTTRSCCFSFSSFYSSCFLLFSSSFFFFFFFIFNFFSSFLNFSNFFLQASEGASLTLSRKKSNYQFNFLGHSEDRGFSTFSRERFRKDFPGQLGASDETYNQSKIDISGSNETMQKVLASII